MLFSTIVWVCRIALASLIMVACLHTLYEQIPMQLNIILGVMVGFAIPCPLLDRDRIKNE